MKLTLKSIGDFRLPLRMDKKEVDVVGITDRSVQVKRPGFKTVRSIDPLIDTYEHIPLEEIKKQLESVQ